jgi:hypothetical protein
MLPNPNLINRLVEQHQHELSEHRHGPHGGRAAPRPHRAGWQRWVAAFSALLLGGF